MRRGKRSTKKSGKQVVKRHRRTRAQIEADKALLAQEAGAFKHAIAAQDEPAPVPVGDLGVILNGKTTTTKPSKRVLFTGRLAAVAHHAYLTDILARLKGISNMDEAVAFDMSKAARFSLATAVERAIDDVEEQINRG